MVRPRVSAVATISTAQPCPRRLQGGPVRSAASESKDTTCPVLPVRRSGQTAGGHPAIPCPARTDGLICSTPVRSARRRLECSPLRRGPLEAVEAVKVHAATALVADATVRRALNLGESGRHRSGHQCIQVGRAGFHRTAGGPEQPSVTVASDSCPTHPTRSSSEPDCRGGAGVSRWWRVESGGDGVDVERVGLRCGRSSATGNSPVLHPFVGRHLRRWQQDVSAGRLTSRKCPRNARHEDPLTGSSSAVRRCGSRSRPPRPSAVRRVPDDEAPGIRRPFLDVDVEHVHHQPGRGVAMFASAPMSTRAHRFQVGAGVLEPVRPGEWRFGARPAGEDGHPARACHPAALSRSLLIGYRLWRQASHNASQLGEASVCTNGSARAISAALSLKPSRQCPYSAIEALRSAATRTTRPGRWGLS